MPEPLFSLLIAQYNNGKYFEDCYHSIIGQRYKNWEVIIVDDGSTDDSVEQMKKLIGGDERFKVYTNGENKGCGFTKRKCAELAAGELLGFLDPDDTITDDALVVMVTEHSKFPEASMIYSKPYWCDEHLNIQYEVSSRQIENNNPEFFDFEGEIFAFISFKKEYYNQTEGISAYLQRAIDKDLLLKLYEVGACLFVDKAMYKYRIHPQGISNSGNADKAYFWYWVAIIDAAKRRNVNVEQLFLDKALKSRREEALEKELSRYNRSFLFKALRKIGLFKI